MPRLPRVTTTASGPTVVLRRARPEESATVGRLVSLDSARPLYGDVVLGVVEGRPVAAASLADGRVVADPFFPSAEVAAVLRDHVAAERAERAAAHRAAERSRARPRLGLAAAS